MLTTMRRLRKAGSSRSSGIRVLLFVACLMLVMIVAACRSSADSANEGLKWRDFDVVPFMSERHPIKSIEEMERTGGFAFVFPSYVPEGMDKKMSLNAWVYGGEVANGESKIQGESMMIHRGRAESPIITIAEEIHSVPSGALVIERDFSSSDRVQDITIGDTNVFCELLPLSLDLGTDERHPRLECNWRAEDWRFSVSFDWSVTTPMPDDITEEMRQEAMKVVESIIVAPEHP